MYSAYAPPSIHPIARDRTRSRSSVFRNSVRFSKDAVGSLVLEWYRAPGTISRSLNLWCRRGLMMVLLSSVKMILPSSKSSMISQGRWLYPYRYRISECVQAHVGEWREPFLQRDISSKASHPEADFLAGWADPLQDGHVHGLDNQQVPCLILTV